MRDEPCAREIARAPEILFGIACFRLSLSMAARATATLATALSDLRRDVARIEPRDHLAGLTRVPSVTPSHSSRPDAFDAMAALRWGTTCRSH